MDEETNAINEKLVTVEAFRNFIDTFKEKVYDWTANGIIKFATNEDIEEMFKEETNS